MQRFSDASVSPCHLVPGYLFAGSCCFVCDFIVFYCWCFLVTRFLQLLHVLLTCKRTSDRQGYVLDRMWRKKN